jgi:hypothetical protein
METLGVDSGSTSPGASLPRFLKPVQSQCSASQASVPVHATYTHKHPFGNAHVLWWPASGLNTADSSPRTILLFIPGMSSSFPGVAHTLVPNWRTHARTTKTTRNRTDSDSRVLFMTSHFASLRKSGTARLLCAIFKRNLSQRQFVLRVPIILRDDLRTLPSRLVILHPTRRRRRQP